MTTLSDLQGLFYQSVVNNDANAERVIETQGALTNADRLGIYAEGYRLRLLEALSDSFPAVHTLLGDESFDHLGRAYIDAHPSTHFSIRYFGHRFAAFIQGYSEIPASVRTLVAEMALFEWSLRSAFDAEDHVPIRLHELTQIVAEDWPRLCFDLAPSLQHLTLQWNTPTLWMAIDAGKGPQPPQRLADSERWVIWRPNLQTRFRSLSLDEGLAMDAVQQGRNFADICSILSDDETDSAQRAAGFLQTWLTENLIAAVHFSE